MNNVTFPKITLPQAIAAFVAAIFPTLNLLGIDLSGQQHDDIVMLRDIALGLFAADAVVRVGRNVHAGMAKLAQARSIDALRPPLPDEGDRTSRPPGA